jgi:hypothetical protein
MQHRKLHPDVEDQLVRIAQKTAIPLERLRRAALGEIEISRHEYGELLASNLPLPKGIKKPFGN